MNIAVPPYILVVDDDARLRQLLGDFLSKEGFLVALAKDAADAAKKIALMNFDALILDVMMPGKNGVDFAANLRRTSTIPIIMLTAQGQPEHRIVGLEAGVDDYLPKPFEPRELVLRLKALLRRAPQKIAVNKEIRVGPWIFIPEREALVQGDTTLRLTPAESQLLKAFLEQTGVVCTREMLAQKIGLEGSSRTVDVQITRLRRKLEINARQPRYLQTVRGEGYVLWVE